MLMTDEMNTFADYLLRRVEDLNEDEALHEMNAIADTVRVFVAQVIDHKQEA